MKWETLVKIAKITKVVFIIIPIIALVLIFIFLSGKKLDEELLTVVSLAYLVGIACLATLFKMLFNDLIKEDKRLKSNNMEYLTEGINVLKKDFLFSGISLGKYGFYIDSRKTVIPYNQIAWVYQKKTSIQLIFNWSSVVIYDYDGNSGEYIVRFKDVLKIVYGLREYYPNILIGYGEQEQKAYYSMLERRYKTRTTQKSLENAIGKGK